jgi:hypothetical protein
MIRIRGKRLRTFLAPCRGKVAVNLATLPWKSEVVAATRSDRVGGTVPPGVISVDAHCDIGLDFVCDGALESFEEGLAVAFVDGPREDLLLEFLLKHGVDAALRLLVLALFFLLHTIKSFKETNLLCS